jgi:hypothetical protein
MINNINIRTHQSIGRCLFITILSVVTIVVLNSCALDLNSVFGISQVVTKPSPQQASPPPAVVRITYNGNGNDSGTEPVDDHEYMPEDMATVMDNTGGLGLKDHAFAGWNTKPDGSGTWYKTTGRTPQLFKVWDRGVMLYAVWSKDIFIKAGENYTGAFKDCAVHIGTGGVWEMKDNSTLMYLDVSDLVFDNNRIVTDSIRSNGYNIYYDEDQAQNSIFGLRTYELPGGGKLMPKIPHDVEASINAVHYSIGIAKDFSGKDVNVNKNYLNSSAILAKDGGVSIIRHAGITASCSGVPMNVPYDPMARWGLGSALYSCTSGVLVAEDVRINVGGDASSGACALYQGFIKLTNSKINCDNPGGKARGLQVSYGGRMDIENLSLDTQTERGTLLAAGPGGGSIRAKNVTGVAHGKGSACIDSYQYGEIDVKGSNLKAEDESAVIIGAKGEVTVKDSSLASNTIAVRIVPLIESFHASGTGTFVNTKIISGGDAFYFNGQSAVIIVQDGTVIEFPKDCKLIRADSKKIDNQNPKKKSEAINASFTAVNVKLQGDVKVAEDGTILKFSLQEGTTYKGAVFGASVSIDDTSEWIVTETCIIAGIDSFSASHITCPKGMRIYYDATINNVGTVKLPGGGELAPVQES